MFFWKLFATAFLYLLVIVYGQTVQNAKDLRTKIFTTDSYDFTVRPIANQSDYISEYIIFLICVTIRLYVNVIKI